MVILYIILALFVLWAVLFFSVAPKEMTNILQRDPAARNYFEVILLYPGLHAVASHRYAHFFYKHKMFLIARIISQFTRFFTGIEIHPGAKIGRGLFIDHGMGIVIGETAEIGDNCTLYQNVTLGGTGKDKGKRHPTIGNNVLIGSGAKVLGPFSVGDNSKIAANAVVLSEVPDNSTAVGVPARIVRINNQRVSSMDLDQIHIPDPTSQEICRLNKLVHDLEEKLEHTEQNHDRKED
jgi:serine O-acetyltransferase